MSILAEVVSILAEIVSILAEFLSILVEIVSILVFSSTSSSNTMGLFVLLKTGSLISPGFNQAGSSSTEFNQEFHLIRNQPGGLPDFNQEFHLIYSGLIRESITP